MATFALSIDVSGIEKLSAGLGNLTAEKIGAALVVAINDSADSAYALGRKTMLSGIKLTDTYVQSKMQVRHATPSQPVATITAFGGREFLTGLSHYGVLQLTQASRGVSRGSSKRGIAPGLKSAGLSVEVVSGAVKPLVHGFTMPGKKDKSGNPLVFARSKDGSFKARHGPSVYQLFRLAAGAIEDDVYADFDARVAQSAQLNFEKELA